MTTGLVGVLLILFGSNLPWGLAEYREATGLLLPISGVAMIPPNGVVSFLFTPLLFAAIACHFYLLANLGHSRSASLALLVTGTLMICVVIVSSAYLHALSEGFFIMLIGCIFTTLAGSLYFWHVNLTPTPPTIRGLQTYLTKAFLRSALTLAGITWIVFIIMYSFPPEMRMLFGF